MMLNVRAWGPTLQERLDRLYAAGMPHAIVVLPDCFTRLGGSQYINSTATGQYEDYLTEELLPFIDSRYRTIAEPAGRGVFGKSSGGYGALIMGMRHADLFGVIACHSGDTAFELCYKPDFPKAANAINAAGGLEAWLQAFEAKPKKRSSDIEALMIIAMAACYSPESAAPLGLALPFELARMFGRAGWPGIRSRWSSATPTRCAHCGCCSSTVARATSTTCTSARDSWCGASRRTASPTSTRSSTMGIWTSIIATMSRCRSSRGR